MSVINLSIQHRLPQDQARAHLRQAVDEVLRRFPPFFQQTEWSDEGNAVKLSGRGFELELKVDAQYLHATGNLAVGGLLAGPVTQGLKQILGRAFPKRLG